MADRTVPLSRRIDRNDCGIVRGKFYWISGSGESLEEKCIFVLPNVVNYDAIYSEVSLGNAHRVSCAPRAAGARLRQAICLRSTKLLCEDVRRRRTHSEKATRAVRSRTQEQGAQRPPSNRPDVKMPAPWPKVGVRPQTAQSVILHTAQQKVRALQQPKPCCRNAIIARRHQLHRLRLQKAVPEAAGEKACERRARHDLLSLNSSSLPLLRACASTHRPPAAASHPTTRHQQRSHSALVA
jgi:hypothetical protein